MIKLIKKKIEVQPRKWHSTLNEALWAYRMAYHGSIKTSPYELVYGHNAVLPWKVQAGLRRVTLQNDLSAEVYKNLMIDDLEDLSCHRLRALENIEANKLRVAKYYNKRAVPSAREGRRGEGRGLQPCRVGQPKQRERGGLGLVDSVGRKEGEGMGRSCRPKRREGRRLSPRSFPIYEFLFYFPY